MPWPIQWTGTLEGKPFRRLVSRGELVKNIRSFFIDPPLSEGVAQRAADLAGQGTISIEGILKSIGLCHQCPMPALHFAWMVVGWETVAGPGVVITATVLEPTPLLDATTPAWLRRRFVAESAAGDAGRN